MKKVVVIVGPTGSGKTALSIKLAKAFNMEIINGDSVQVYQRLNIGSAKIAEKEKQGVPHHLIDFVNPKDQYSVYEFQHDVRKYLDNIDFPLIVGGTGLYIKAALYHYEFEEIGRDPEFELKHEIYETNVLYEMLKSLDPLIKVDAKNRRRVLRALEQAQLGYLRSDKKLKDEILYDGLILYLDLDRKVLEERLQKRLDIQLQQGFLDEVKSLKEDGIYINAIGYKELYAYLNNEISFDEAKIEIIHKSKMLAKKQKTWFKNQMNPMILDALSDTLFDEAYQIVKNFLKGVNK
ncbi:MAG: tRNA (adenosine(37)-N6)-dimethylallyltransferase MiaA [Acholeplasmataceae bacterium]